MRKLKVMTVVGTRPEIIRLSRVLAKLDEYCNHVIVHTGQNYDYELNEVFFSELNIRKPNYFLGAAGINAAATIGNIIIEIDKVLEIERPDAVLVLGDTNSCMAILPAKRRKIPTFHMEAGNRCFDQRVPEEINRKIVDHISDINLTYSDIAREYLLREGLLPDRIIKTGSPMYEVLTYYKKNIDMATTLDKLKLSPNNFFVFSVHREENIDNPYNFQSFISLLNLCAEKYRLPIILSTHPRTRKKIESENVVLNSRVQMSAPLGFFDYIKLQTTAKAVLSDSGTISEESSILNFPALNLREAHERPEAMEEGSVMMVGMCPQTIVQALAILEKQQGGVERTLRPVVDYSVPNVSEKVVRIIISYTEYINKVVWKK